MMRNSTIPQDYAEAQSDLDARIEEAIRTTTVRAIASGKSFTAWDVAQRVEDELPDGYPKPAHGSRIVSIHVSALVRLTEIVRDTPGAIEWVSFADYRPTPECPSWCNFHRPDCEDCHFGQIVVNDIEIEIQLEPSWDAPRVDLGGYDWVNGPELTDLAEALHIAERLLSGPEAVAA